MDCAWAWGVGLKCCGIVLGLGGLVWGLREGGVGLGCDGFWGMVLGGCGGTGWVRRLVGWVLGVDVLCWGMGGCVWGLEGCFGFGRGGFGLARGGFGTVWCGFGGMVLGFCGWDRAGQDGFAGWCVGVLGLVGGVGVWRAGFGGLGVVLGLGGSVLGSRGVCWDWVWWFWGMCFWGVGVGQVGFAGWWVVFLGQVGCVRAWGIGISDWRGGYGLG